nr:hypothetical protein [Tanacetum cinerariifolium]
MACQIVQKKLEEKQTEEEQAAKAQNSKIPACCDDEDDYNSAITPNEPVDSLESMLNHDSSIISSSLKIDSLLNEFAGKLTLLKSIPPGIDKTDCHPKNEIRLIERLLYENSSPRPLKEFVSKHSNADIGYFSPSPVPVEDSDSFMEEIDLTFTPDDPMAPGIKDDDDDDSKRDILIHKELLDNYSLSLPIIESFYFDIPSFSRPPAKPPDGNTGILNIKMMGDIFDQKYSRKLKDSCQMILSSKSSFPQLLLGINLLHLAGSQTMLKSSYKAEDGVIISIPPLVGGVADVVVEIKGTGWSISITFWFSVGLQTPDDLSRSRLGFIEKMGVKDKQEKNKIRTKAGKKREAWKSPAMQKSSYSQESRKREENTSSKDQTGKS